MATITLNGSVGAGKAKGDRPHNDPDDFLQIRDRLVELGYAWVKDFSLGSDKDFVRSIKLFQCICEGATSPQRKGKPRADWHISDSKKSTKLADGRIDAGGDTHKWIAAENAPGWTTIKGKEGIGWRCTTAFPKENYFTTTWMMKTIFWIGLDYVGKLANVRVKSFLAGEIRKEEYPPIWIRECSLEKGGKTNHGSHQTGLDLDIRLPLLPPNHHKYDNLGKKGFNDPKYDQDTAISQLQAINSQRNVSKVFFGDPETIRLRLSKRPDDHHDQHFHVRISPPARIEGAASVTPLAAKSKKLKGAKQI